MRIIGLLAVILSGGLLLYQTSFFPAWGGHDAPAANHLSPYFIEHTIGDTSVPNIVTSVLADYRGYDTMFETTVVLSAGIACFFLLRTRRKKGTDARFYRHIPTGVTIRISKGGEYPDDASKVFRRIDSQWTPYDLIVRKTCGYVIPFIQLYALYVVAHGHHSPGGGFQGGVILGATVILFALSTNLRAAISKMSEKSAGILGAVGVMLYAGTGAFCLLMNENFLNYSALAPLLGGDPVMARSHSILIVETGVAIAVMAIMIWLYYNLSSAGRHDEGL